MGDIDIARLRALHEAEREEHDRIMRAISEGRAFLDAPSPPARWAWTQAVIEAAPALLDEVERLRDERNDLLAQMRIMADGLRDSAIILGDLPPDTVLGESGKDAVREVADVYESASACLCNYNDVEQAKETFRSHRETVLHWARKTLDHKREIDRIGTRLAALERVREAAMNLDMDHANECSSDDGCKCGLIEMEAALDAVEKPDG